MMTALLVSMVLGGVDSLGPVTLGGLTLKAPTQWAKSQPDANSLTWEESQSGASMAISAYAVDPQRPGKGCVAQLVGAVGPEGFKNFSVGSHPASRRVTTDYLGEGEEAKVDSNKVTTTTVLGCNGKIKWVLTWSAKTSMGTRFGPILKRVLDSISYRK
jgi:hypothetical protein